MVDNVHSSVSFFKGCFFSGANPSADSCEISQTDLNMATLEQGNCVPVGSAVFHVRFFGEDVSKGTKQQKNDGKMGEMNQHRDLTLRRMGMNGNAAEFFIRYLESNMTVFFHLPKKSRCSNRLPSWDFEVPMCITRQPWIPMGYQSPGIG